MDKYLPKVTMVIFAFALVTVACGENPPESTNIAQRTSEADSMLLQRAHAARIVGNPEAPVRIYEATDFSCPTCRTAYERNSDSLRSEFIDTGEAVLIYVASPLPFLLRSYHGAEAAICAGGLAGQEGFLAMIDALYRQQEEWRHKDDPRDQFMQYADGAGISGSEFADCIDRNAVAPLILSDLSMLGGLRVQGLDIPGTPTYIFNESETFYGAQPLSRFREAIQSAGAVSPAQ